MRSRYRITRKTKGVMIAVVVAAFLGGAGSVVAHLVTDDTPAPVAPVAVVVNGPDYAGYAFAIEGLGVDSALASPAFVDNLCPNLKSWPSNERGVTYGQVRGWAPGSPIASDDTATLLAIAGDAKAFVCYR